MRWLPLLLSASTLLALGAALRGHGAVYPPPSSESPPPGAGGGGPGGAGGGGPPYTGPGDIGRSPGGSIPSPATTGPRGSTPARPASGAPGGAAAGPAGLPASASTQGPGLQADLTAWHYWWHFNKDPFLQLKARLYALDPLTSGAELFLGRGQVEEPGPQLRPTRRDVREEIVPALARALEGQRSDAIVSSALIALARIGDDPTRAGAGLSPMAELLREKLAAPSQEIQETAALALGILANERNVFLLAQLLEGDSAALRSLGVDFGGAVPERTRAYAAFALGLIGHAASVPARAEIVRILALRLDAEGRAASRSDLAVGCITALGLTPLPWRRSSSPGIGGGRAPSPDALRSREDQLAWLLELCEERELADVVAAHLPVAIGRLLRDAQGPEPARLRALERLARDLAPRASVDNLRRRGAALALGLIADADNDEADRAARQALVAAVDDVADRQTRFFALLSLAQVASRPGSGQGDALWALTGGEDVRGLLLERLARGRSGLRPWAALALGVLEHNLRELGRPGSGEARAAVLELLSRARSAEERGALAIAAGLFGGPEAAQGLRDALQRTSDPDALVHVAVGLGLAGQRSDLEALLELARSSRFRPALMEAAATGAGLLGGRQVSEELVQMLDDSTGLASQASICRGLGLLGDRRAVPALLALLEDGQRPDLARGFAAVALGLVADKQDLPWGSVIAVQSNYRADVPTLYDPYGSSGVLNLH